MNDVQKCKSLTCQNFPKPVRICLSYVLLKRFSKGCVAENGIETESTILKPEVNMTGNSNDHSLKNPCTQKKYVVTESDFPIACPPKSERIWDAHPRVYLEANEHGKIICPYCSTEFVIQSN